MAINGKVALITGAADGIGRATATEFAAQGARLFLCDINEEGLASALRELRDLGGEAEGIQYDARKTKDIEKVFDALLAQYGDIDILVNNTGIPGPTAPITDISLEDWDSVMEINLRSGFYFCKLAAPYMMKKREGKIVNLSSMTGKRSLFNRIPYCTSKIGIIGLTRSLAEELGAYNINVNAVCPGVVEGARGRLLVERAMQATGKTYEEVWTDALSTSFLKRPVQPEDIAKLIAFLSDDALSRQITAQDYNINCGIYSD